MARGDVLVILVQKTRKLRDLRVIIHAITRSYPAPPYAGYEVNNGKSTVNSLPRPMMEGECSLYLY